MELEKGKTYYMLTYADPDFTMPGVQPMVYIGMNAYLRCLEDSRDTYQFQDTVSYVRFGSVMETGHKDECRIEAFLDEALGTSIMSLENISDAIAKSIERSKQLGGPVLSVSKGNWVTARTQTWVQIGTSDKNGSC